MKLLAMVALAALIVAGCNGKRDPEPDVCQGAEANPLRFRILESTGAPTPDTAYAKQDIMFEAPGAPYTKYQWRVGTDSRVFTQRRFSLYFYDENAGTYTVRLIAYRPPNTRCFPKDDGIDTLTRTLTLLPYATLRAPIYGKFQGSTTDSPRDTFTVRVLQGSDPYNQGSNVRYNFLRNLSRGCQSPTFVVALTWRGIDFSYGRVDFGCLEEAGRGYLTNRDSLRIDYTYTVPNGNPRRVSRIFLGRRIR